MSRSNYRWLQRKEIRNNNCQAPQEVMDVCAFNKYMFARRNCLRPGARGATKTNAPIRVN